MVIASERRHAVWISFAKELRHLRRVVRWPVRAHVLKMRSLLRLRVLLLLSVVQVGAMGVRWMRMSPPHGRVDGRTVSVVGVADRFRSRRARGNIGRCRPLAIFTRALAAQTFAARPPFAIGRRDVGPPATLAALVTAVRRPIDADKAFSGG